MLRYPTSEIKLTSKDFDSAEEIQQQYLEKKLKKHQENNDQQIQTQLQLQQQEQQDGQQRHLQQEERDESPSRDSSSSLSFIYNPPELLNDPVPQIPSIGSPNLNTTIESSYPHEGIKRPNMEPESSKRKRPAQEQRVKITRQRLGIDQQTPKKK
ncbi:unnamed protein product [Absidia cylindrospora]